MKKSLSNLYFQDPKGTLNEKNAFHKGVTIMIVIDVSYPIPLSKRSMRNKLKTGAKAEAKPKIPLIVIDHNKTNLRP